MGKYFGTDGFRGEAGITLTADHAYKVGRFLGWYYNKLRERNGNNEPARIVIGKDTRRSSYMFENALAAGIAASGTDAYLLAAYVRPAPHARGIDLGSGTGIIPLLCLARDKASSFLAVEMQEVFCSIIRENAVANGFSGRLAPLCADLRDLRPADTGGEADLITANPPYLKAGSGARNRTDEKFFARHEAAGDINDFCRAAGRLLRYGGRFYCVFRPERLTDLHVALRGAGLEPKRTTFVHATPFAAPSLVLTEAMRGAAPSLSVTPPLFLWEPDAACPRKPDARMIPSAQSAYIYEHCSFPEEYR